MSEPQPSQQPGGKRTAREDALAVVRRLREAGHVAYFAGGCVRDQLLGLEPKDYDVATDAPPTRVRELFTSTQAVGAAFGVILVRQRKSQIEVATFRTDGKYTDGRRPDDVVFTTAEEDAKRRDFTINGMFFDPLEERVIDYVGGHADVRDKVLRAIGNPNERFEEDHLRILRAVRFAARFGLDIEAATAWAMTRQADALRRISQERVAGELRLMLAPPSRSVAWAMLWKHGLLHILMRTLPVRTKPSPATFDADRSLLLKFAAGEGASFGTALAVGSLCYLWHSSDRGGDVTPLLAKQSVQQTTRALRMALKLSNEEIDEVEEVLISIGPLLSDVGEPSVAQMKRFLGRRYAPGARQLLEALESSGLHAERIAWLSGRLADLSREDFAPPPFVTGDDLTAAGLQPGPVFKRVLDAVYDAQLEDRVRTKDEAMRLAMELAGS